jgi:hypothetical protein
LSRCDEARDLVSFLQIKTAMVIHKKIRQVKYEIGQRRRETAHVWLEAIAEAEKFYSLMKVFRRGHSITKSSAVAYMTQCNLVEMGPQGQSQLHRVDSGDLERD